MRGSTSRYWVIVGLWLLTLSAYATPPRQGPRVRRAVQTAPAPVPDSLRLPPAGWAPPDLQAPDATHYAELRARRAYQYTPPTDLRPSLWDRFWGWFWQKVSRALNSRAGSRTVEILFYLLIAGALVWALLLAMRLDLTGLLGRAPVAAPTYEVEEAETPFTAELTEKLHTAEAAADWRLAARLGYLLALRHLADRELLRWEPARTNQFYVRQLPPGAVRDLFTRLTRQFEVAWYGETPLSAADYATVRATFTALLREIGAPVPASAATLPPVAPASSATT